MSPITEHTIIKEKARFRAGQREDGYQKSLTTGTVFVDLSAAYDSVNHRVLLTKLYGMIEDVEFTKLIGSMMSNRRFYVELNGRKADGAIRRMVYLVGLLSHGCYSMSIQTTCV